MLSEFAAMGRAARERIPVPDLSMDSIRARSRAGTTRGRARLLVACSALCVVVLAAGVAFGARFYDGVRVWLSGNTTAVVVNSLAIVREPTASDLRDLTARATFPIVFPVGVPADTHVTMLMYAPAEHPNTVTIAYRNQRTNFNVGLTLVDSSLINPDNTTLPAGAARPPLRESYHWQIGNETVLVPKEHIASGDANRIEAEMTKVSSADSFSVTETMLSRITILGGAPTRVDIAERYAPPKSHGVLLDRQQVRSISDLFSRGKPVLDTRTVYLSNIPSVHGEPDYSNASLHWPKVVVISEGGVRAIEAVLRSTSIRDDCGCEILFTQPSKMTYWVWKIPISSAPVVRKYTVDAKTFAVTQSAI